MEQTKLNNITRRVTQYIESGRLRDAFNLLRGTAESAMQWEVSDRVAAIEKNYAYMLAYLTDGATDPDRDKIYRSLVSDTYSALDDLGRRLMSVDCPTLYFNTVRTQRLRPQTLSGLLEQHRNLVAQANNLVERLVDGLAPDPKGAMKAEHLERDIFNYLWTVYPLSTADADAFSLMLSDTHTPLRLKRLAVSAMALGLLEYYDSARMLRLMDVYADPEADMAVSSAALTALLLALFKYRRRPLATQVEARLKILADTPTWQSDIKTAFLELIRTRDTERINRTMREEIIPSMMKMRPDILRKMSDNPDAIDPETLEMNPEWEEMLRESGLADRIRDLSELQQEGADVFMSTFAHLKSFPFFNDVANWFLPFDTQRSEIAEVGLPQQLADLIASLPFLCDSDKYSFILSLNAVPQSQRQMMLTQFEAQRGAQLEDMMRAEATLQSNRRKEAVSAFLQNLYRFLNLYRRKGEFYNPFTEGVNLLKVDSLSAEFKDTETVSVVAEFFFKCGYWDDALLAFEHLDSIADAPDGVVFQKAGYCCQRLGNTDSAIEYYHQAELFSPDSQWLMQRLATAYRQKGDYRQATGYYKRLADANPESVDAALNLGYVLTQAGDREGALQQFFKAEFLDENGTRALRPLAWTLFTTGDLKRSHDYYVRIINDNPTATDYLNMGHVALARANHREAINFYKLCLDKNGGDTEALIKSVRDDAPDLNRAGVTDSVIALILDALLYSLK